MGWIQVQNLPGLKGSRRPMWCLIVRALSEPYLGRKANERCISNVCVFHFKVYGCKLLSQSHLLYDKWWAAQQGFAL